MTGEEVFYNPVTCRPWHDERSQREHYWQPAIKRLGIRMRRAYQTRHTYATMLLMSGVNPAYVSRQLGHANAQMLFRVYAKWIDRADRGREMAKFEASLSVSASANSSLILPKIHKYLIIMVGVRGFEPPTPASRTRFRPPVASSACHTSH